ncbi:MAG: mercury resistance system transport protein MerF [Amylibacter sp.]
MVWLFLAVGLSAIIGYLDMILFPALFIFICITGYALWQRTKKI